MCGIAGIYRSKGDCKAPLGTVQRMVATLHHRGPDESGIYIDQYVGLGHSRLSIIDLPSGIQPIHNEDETVWVVFNGEIYNYPELRRTLTDRGHKFSTSTDTEVLVHLYEDKGVGLLDDLNGQFAFAIWDSAKRQLFLARDHTGIRPLHYTHHEGSLLFASEVKALFTCEGLRRQIDPLAMEQIFTFWTTLPGHTAFKGIHELPPGHLLLASKENVTVRKYWDIPLCPRDQHVEIPIEQISGRVRELLRESVRIRLRADVPVGCYLSGGLDSSTISALVAREFNHDVQTYGIRFQEQAYDEGEHQQTMASFLKVSHREIQATNERIGAAFSDVLWHCEKPMLRTSSIPLFLLSQKVRDDRLKVVLTGEGADEVFGGYNIFKEAKIRRFWARQPDSDARAQLLQHLYPYIFNNVRSKAFLKSFFGKGLENVDDPLFSHLLRWQNTARIKRFFSADLQAAIGSYDPVEQLRESMPAFFDDLDAVAKAQYLEMTVFMSNHLLCSQGDRVAMAHSVEARMPFLDPKLMEFMGKVPSRWKVLGVNEKHILKKAFRQLLPPGIVKRNKHPYRAPIKHSLLSHGCSKHRDELLSKKYIEQAGLFDAARVAQLLNKMDRTDEPGEIDSMALAGVLSAQIIYNRFVDSYPSQADIPAPTTLLVDRRPQSQRRQGSQLVGAKHEP